MTTESPGQPATGDNAIPSLYDVRNVARRTVGVGPALKSTNQLLDAIRESVAGKSEYIEMEQSCVGIREVLSRETNRKQDDRFSLPALEAIEELTTTANEIKRNIVKQGKRLAIFRALRHRKEKEAIATWRLSLNRILGVLEMEFRSGEPATVSGTRHDGADVHTAVVDVHSGPPNAEPIALTAPRDIPSSRPVSEIPTVVVNTHTLSREAHRDAPESSDGKGNPSCSARVSEPDESLPPLRNARGTISDTGSRFERTDTTEGTRETFDGAPRQINEGAGDKYQVAEESAPGESPPPPPKIFGRDELVKEIVNLVDADNPTPIALIGTGGIGKTSVALAVLHDNRIKQRFGHYRRLLRCNQFSASLPNFLRKLSEVIGAGIENPPDLNSLRPFLSRNRMLIIIDNAESIFDGPATKDIDPAIEELSQFGNIWLCITSRISIIPTRCKVIDIPTLSMEAARETFYNIYHRGEKSDTVDDILKQLDFHPLSIILLATAAKKNKWGTGQLKEKWEEQRTGVLRTRYDGSLAATIEFSLRSPMFLDLGPHARDLLGVVAFFPLGVDENNLDWLFPSITDSKKIFDRFCALSLTHRNKSFITMLAPLCDHLCPKDPMSASLLCSAKECYFSRLSSSIEATEPGDDQTRWITSEDVNVEHLLDIFTSADANSEAVWDACQNFMRHLYRDKPRIPVIGPKIQRLPDGYPSKPQCLSELSTLCAVVENPADERRLLCHALKLYRERGDDAATASTLSQLSTVTYRLNLYEEGIQRAMEAMEIYERLGDVKGVITCNVWLSFSFHSVNRPDDADECETRVIELIDTLMPTADPELRCFFHASLACIYGNKGDTEKASFHHEAHLRLVPDRSLRFHSSCTLAQKYIQQGRFDDAEAHLEHARSLAANGSFEPGMLMSLRADLLRVQGKFEEARSDALRALDLVEEFGGGKRVEEVKELLQTIDKEVVEWASMGELLVSLAHRAELRMIRAPLGGDISQDEKIHEAVTKMIALLEEDSNRPGAPGFSQTKKAYEELAALLDHHVDKEKSEAITESLAVPTAVDGPDEMPPPEPLMRRDKEPVVIWTTDPEIAHIEQLWQALYHVPQVRHRISRYRSPRPLEGNTEADPLSGETGGYVSSAHDLFGHMELSGLTVVTDKTLMERFPHRRWEGISPCKDVEKAYKEFSERVEISLNDGLATQDPDWPRLFHSRINDAMSQGRSAFDTRKDFSLISLEHNDGNESSDLMGCLASQVLPEFPERRSPGADQTTTGGCATMEPADVIAFALARDESPPSPAAGRSQQQRKFSFPESFCLDQFVTTSRARVQDTNVGEGEILRETGSDPAKPTNEDITKGIPLSLHHYENAANPPTDVERHSAIDRSAKLEDEIPHTKAERNSIGTATGQPREKSESPPSSKLAEENNYDLRVVLMHDGQKGQKYVYSYINHDEVWWKVVDSTVTQVTLDTVLNDESGTDVGAGPFFLVYSRSLSEPLKSEWPETLVRANGRFHSTAPGPSKD